MNDREVRAVLMDLAIRRGPDKTFCPSEAARLLADDWRPMMDVVRRVAADLQADHALQGFQKGVPVAIDRARGPIRLGLPVARTP